MLGSSFISPYVSEHLSSWSIPMTLYVWMHFFISPLHFVLLSLLVLVLHLSSFLKKYDNNILNLSVSSFTIVWCFVLVYCFFSCDFSRCRITEVNMVFVYFVRIVFVSNSMKYISLIYKINRTAVAWCMWMNPFVSRWYKQWVGNLLILLTWQQFV